MWHTSSCVFVHFPEYITRHGLSNKAILKLLCRLSQKISWVNPETHHSGPQDIKHFCFCWRYNAGINSNSLGERKGLLMKI